MVASFRRPGLLRAYSSKRADGAAVTLRDAFERRSRAFDRIFRGFAALAERVEHRFDEGAERVGRHGGEIALVDGGEVGLVHFGDELLDRTHQHVGRHIPEKGHAATVIPVGRQLLEAAENVAV